MMWYLTDGRSLTLPPRTSTTECSCRLCPMPGMYAVTSIWLVSRTRAILRSAEFGFLGVIVRTCRQTPRFWGAPGIETWRCRRLFQFLRIAGALILEILRWRPCRTSWLIVGTKTLLLSVGPDAVAVMADRWDRSLPPSVAPVRAAGGTGDVMDGGEMVVGARADGGPLPRPRGRSLAAA